MLYGKATLFDYRQSRNVTRYYHESPQLDGRVGSQLVGSAMERARVRRYESIAFGIRADLTMDDASKCTIQLLAMQL